MVAATSAGPDQKPLNPRHGGKPMPDQTRTVPFPPAKPAEPPRLVEPLLTKAQAARLLAVCPRTVDNLIAAGRLKLVKLGTAARIDPKDLRAFIDAAKGD